MSKYYLNFETPIRALDEQILELESSNDPTPPDNWITQLKWCFNDFNMIQFYKVSSLKKVNEWDEIENIHYITFDEMWTRLNR